MGGGFISEHFQSYDALNRFVSSYAFPPCPFVNKGAGQIFCTKAPVATTRTYDTSNNLGLLTSTLDPLGQSKIVAYDAIGRVTNIQYAGSVSPESRAFSYDADGNTTGLTLNSESQTYRYDSNGHPIVAVDSSGVQSNLGYYPDGLLQSLSVPSLSGLVANYSYRSDGLLQTKSFTYPGVANHLAYSYTAAGRYTGMADFSTQQSQRAGYDQFGRLASYVIPAGTYSGFTYDLEDRISSYQAFGGETVTNQYGVRGDLLAQTFWPNAPVSSGGAQWPSFAYTSAQGVLVQSSDEQWDGRSGAVLGFASTGAIYSYDADLRLSSISQGTTTQTFGYDAENHQISGSVADFAGQSNACNPGRIPEVVAGGYTWGPEGEVETQDLSALNSVAWDYRHYVLGQLLYSATGGPQQGAAKVNALHVGVMQQSELSVRKDNSASTISISRAR